MLPYFILLILVVIGSFLAERGKSNKVIYSFFVGAVFFILVLFAGLRDRSVGTDTGSYVSRYLSLDQDFINNINDGGRIEFAYRLLESVALLFSDQYVAILMMISFVAVFFQLKSIYKLSEQPLISIFILITFGIYTYVFNGARQALAAAIYMYALTFLVNANFRKYLLWVVIASLFHKSVIFGIPLYFLFRRKFTKKLFLFLSITTLVMVLFFDILIKYAGFISEQYLKYDEIDKQGGIYLTLAYVLLSGFFVLMRSKIKPMYKVNYDIFLNMFLFGTMVYLVVYFSGAYVEMTRLAFYYIVSTVFIWPMIFKSLKQNQIALVFLSFLFVHIAFFYIFIGKMSNLTPYTFNLTLF